MPAPEPAGSPDHDAAVLEGDPAEPLEEESLELEIFEEDEELLEQAVMDREDELERLLEERDLEGAETTREAGADLPAAAEGVSHTPAPLEENPAPPDEPLAEPVPEPPAPPPADDMPEPVQVELAKNEEPAPRGTPPKLVRLLAAMNYPVRLLPPPARAVVDWIALSLIFWVPIVWLIAILVVGR